MPLLKQPLNINFAQGLDTKTDPFQVSPGKFLSLENSVFDKGGRLTKRNGFSELTVLPDNTNKYLTTFNNNLTAIGTTLQAYSAGANIWVDKGSLIPVDLETIPLVRSGTYQGQADSAVAPNGLVCTGYTDYIPDGSGGVTATYKWVINDSVTGQNIVEPTLLVGADATYGTPRVFVLGAYFIIMYTTHPGSYHIQYIAVSTMNPTIVTSPTDITSSYIPSTTVNFDGLVVNDRLYVAYNTTSGGQSVNVTYLPANLFPALTPHVFAGSIATMFTLAADTTSATRIYISWYDLGTTNGYTAVVDQNLNVILAPTEFTTGTTLLNLASTAQNGSTLIFAEVSNAYGYDSGIATNFIDSVTVSVTGTVGSITTVVRSVGLASKAFLYNGVSYFLSIYNSAYQPTYFLINQSGQVICELAYSNGGQYYTLGLPNVTVTGTDAQFAYLYKDSIQAVNKTQGIANSAGIYSQLGVNLATVNFAPQAIISTEIGNNLNITGGYITAYDGFSLVEQEFFLWPDYVEATPHTTGGFMAAQTYFYQVIYQWSDNAGNLFRSAPSIPVEVITTSATSSVTIDVPTLRLTYKTLNPIDIVIYRWSTAQQNYYQVTSIISPLQNDTTIDYVTFTDTLADSSILGNSLIYTTGGVLENIGPPASSIQTLFNNRVWLVDSEDRNLLWFSKQVIEATPVEFSDLLTLYVAPSTASEGSTGPITALAPMDDKLIIYKANALGYINGIGPDNTGANSSYSDFILINSVVGCTNSHSIVFTPNGLMFQSNKGIWLLGRDLSTQYIGAPVESLTTGVTVLSALNIPATNQVRFTLSSGVTLMYDYYYNQWGTFVNVPAVSSTIYSNLHTYIDTFGRVFQESEGKYLDNTSPVLMSFSTNWISLAGLQGYERFYQMYLLGEYITPFKLNVQLAYDYNSSTPQSTMVTPVPPTGAWGSDALWGTSTPWGGPSNIFEARVFPQKQKCESFQVSMTEIYDPSYGIASGAGLTLSGLNLVIGVKRGFRTQSAARSFG